MDDDNRAIDFKARQRVWIRVAIVGAVICAAALVLWAVDAYLKVWFLIFVFGLIVIVIAIIGQSMAGVCPYCGDKVTRYTSVLRDLRNCPACGHAL